MIDDTVPLLLTKVQPPRLRHGTVARPRLLERLRRPGRPVLTLVSAPAGFGKTTLLTDWLVASSTDHTRTAWVLLDRQDNDPARFWSYVVAALRTVAPTSSTARLFALPIAAWEFTIGVYMIVKGFRPSPVTDAIDREASALHELAA